MTIFVDASAIVAIIDGEAEADAFSDAIEAHNDRCYCAVGAWEAAHAIARLWGIDLPEAGAVIAEFAHQTGLRLVTIGVSEGRAAIDAAARYGKLSKHPAKLNMADCFAYACAKANGASLLYKGNDFSHTDFG
ncbi:MAG: type II toxin-antitoxin system VapC family toxin [Sphingomonas phyllosphaerae]